MHGHGMASNGSLLFGFGSSLGLFWNLQGDHCPYRKTLGEVFEERVFR